MSVINLIDMLIKYRTNDILDIIEPLRSDSTLSEYKVIKELAILLDNSNSKTFNIMVNKFKALETEWCKTQEQNLVTAINDKDIEKIKELYPKLENKYCMSLLEYSVYHDHPFILQNIINDYNNVEDIDDIVIVKKLIIYSLQHNNTEILKILLNTFIQQALDILENYVRDNDTITSNKIIDLINFPNNSLEYLTLVCIYLRHDVLEFLLSKNIDINATDVHGYNIAHALFGEYDNIVRGYYDETIFVQIIKLLVKSGLNVNSKNNEGYTVFDMFLLYIPDDMRCKECNAARICNDMCVCECHKIYNKCLFTYFLTIKAESTILKQHKLKRVELYTTMIKEYQKIFAEIFRHIEKELIVKRFVLKRIIYHPESMYIKRITQTFD
jgi:hypothetical protein